MTEDQWTRAAPLLEAALACSRGTHSVADVRRMHAEGQVILWLGERAAVVTIPTTYPGCRVMHVWLAAGELKELDRLRSGIEALSRGQGFRRLTASPEARRGGWTRIAAAAGWAPAWTIYAKELEA